MIRRQSIHMTPEQEAEVQQLFVACDLNGSGFIEKDELSLLCVDLELTDQEFDDIFNELDVDHDGVISQRDFRLGFQSVTSLLQKKAPKGESPSGSPLLRARGFSFDASSVVEISSSSSDEEGFILNSKRNNNNQKSSSSRSNSRNRSSSKGKGNNSGGLDLLPTPYTSVQGNNSPQNGAGYKHSSSSPGPVASPYCKKRKSSSALRAEEAALMESCMRALSEVDSGFYQLPQLSQEQVCELYQQLHHAEVPHLLALFENVLVSMIKEIRTHTYENERLEKSYNREKETHARHLRQLEEEMEAQMARVESRVRSEEREKSDFEKEELRSQMEAEILELNTNLKRLQKLDVEVVKSPNDETKARMDELTQDNRSMRSSLTDAQTNLAILRSEIATLRQQYEEKCDELECERENMVEYIKEQDNLTRQVHLLQNANKKLHDTNDDLRAAIENSRNNSKRPYLRRTSPMYYVLSQRSLLSRKSETNLDMINAYMTPPTGYNRSVSMNSSLADELRNVRNVLPTHDSIEMDNDNCSLPGDIGDIDSGHSTMSTLRDVQDIESEYEPNSFDDDYHNPMRNRRIAKDFDSTCESELPESTDEMETEIDRMDSLQSYENHSINMELDDVDGLIIDEDQLNQATDDLHLHFNTSSPRDRSMSPSQRGQCNNSIGSLPCRSRSHSPRPPSPSPSHCSNCSHTSSRSGSRSRIPVTTSMTSANSSSFRRLPQIQKPITGQPERMYKVVLAGDAAVGKSSFIMRLCKNKFVSNLNSTLGVDFQTKILEVDGRIIALQLWDTAGQERFRSIAKSYFRRADGVLMLYDTTYERSFLNVRDWVQAVEDGAQKKIPIMLCGNKSDLREEYKEEGKRYVRTEDGQRLAREFEGVFIETSAKSGDNVQEAVTELARMLRTSEDLEVKSVGMKLQDMKEEKKGISSCCN